MTSRLGPHVIVPTVAGLNWVDVAPIVKSIDNVAVLVAAPPNAIRVFRHFLPVQNLNDPQGTVDAILGALGGYRHPNLLVELWNEAKPPLASLQTAVTLVHNAGLKCCGASWSTGNYDYTDFDNAVLAGQDAISVHCYWGNEGFTIYEALRYRTYWKTAYPPVLITECGRDAVEGGLGGWVKDGLTPQRYAAELTAYDAEISKDSYVLGATPFTSGPTSDWNNYNMDPVSPLLIGTPTPQGRTTMLKGIDISNYQGAIDWSLLARYAPDFVLMKASEGTNYTDPTFATNWKAAQANGIPRGAYHFCRPSGNSGHAEAEYYLNVVETAGGFQSGDLPIIDMEDNKVAFNADLLAYELDFYGIADPAVGVPTLQYSSLSYMLAHTLTGHTELANHGLWLADWQTSHLPGVPAPWTVFAFWQYSANGTVPGIQGLVDLDLFNGDATALRKYGKP